MGSGVLIQITPQLRILVAVEPIDGRKGIDSIAQLCREKLDRRPGVLAGDETIIKRALQMVADWGVARENLARASGAVAAGGREPGCRRAAGVAASERIK